MVYDLPHSKLMDAYIQASNLPDPYWDPQAFACKSSSSSSSSSSSGSSGSSNSRTHRFSNGT
jgi:hypothetical protein